MSAISNSRPVPVETPGNPTTPAAEPRDPQSKKPWKWLILLAIVGGAGFAGWKYMAPGEQNAESGAAAPATVRTVKVTTANLVNSVRVAGQTSARVFTSITAPVPRGPESRGDMILLFLLPSGSKVKKGQMVAEIDSQGVVDHVDDITDSIEASDADIRKRQAEHLIDSENLNQTLQVTKAEWDKAVLEAKALEVRTTIDQELLKLAAEEAEARYKQASADIKFKKDGQAAEIRILQITRERHVRHKARHTTDMVRYKILAPMDGLAVVQMTWRGGEMGTIQQGDNVQPGQLFMKVVDPNTMQVEANINQTESSMFRVSQKATVRFDAFPGLALPAHVYSIGALAAGGFRQQYYIRNLPVRVSLDAQNAKVIPDLSASADVVIETVQNARQVPLAALFEEQSGTFVYVKTAKGFERRTVKAGVRNGTHAAIESGLNDGDEVAVEAPPSVPRLS